MADWNDPNTWAKAYGIRGGRPNKMDIPGGFSIGAGFGEDLSYLDGRKFTLQYSDDGLSGLAKTRYALQKLEGAGFTPASETLVVGCGFGWSIELIVDAGSNNVWGSDTSSLIHAGIIDPNVGVRSDIQPLIFNINIEDPDAKDQFLSVAAGTNKGEFRTILTEHVLEGIPQVDIPSFLSSCTDLLVSGQSRVYHMIIAMDAIDDPNLIDSDIIENQWTLSEWTAFNPTHYWIDSITGAFGGGQ